MGGRSSRPPSATLPTPTPRPTTVDRIRDSIADVQGADAIAGGDTATRADTLRASADDNVRIIPLILGVVLLILILLLRALTAPLILMATVVLSYGAAMGISALIFRQVLGFAGADSSLPLFVFVFLVALGIDYNIFLMTRVHEEAKEIGTRRGALVGLAATGGVITSAGPRPRRHVRRARHPAGRDLRRDRDRRRPRRPARHARSSAPSSSPRSTSTSAAGCGGRVRSRGGTATWTRRARLRPRTRPELEPAR